jgi:peptidoglycan/LPS O-acetylase OafA/YrhL
VHLAGAQTRESQTVSRDHEKLFVTLDGLRGVAALAIAIRHAPFLWPQGYPTALFSESYLAVDFFFVLSGFVLSLAYMNRLQKGMPPSQFMILRLIRLYPIYFLAFLLSLAIPLVQMAMHGAIQKVFLNVIFAALFMPSPVSSEALFPLNIPAWSLFFELLASLAFGYVLYRLRPTQIAAGLLLAGLLLILAVSFKWLGFGMLHGAMDAGLAWTSFYAGLVRISYSFLAGMMAFTLWRRGILHIQLPPLMLIFGFCFILTFYHQSDHRLLFELTVTILVFPLIVIFGACSQPGRTMARFYEWLGGISYPVYVLQFPVYGLSALFIDVDGISFGWAAVSVMIVVIIASFVDRYFDRPARRAITNALGMARRSPNQAYSR